MIKPFDFTIIRTLRMKLGLTAEELAGRARITRATVAKLESGKGNPTIETILALGKVFGLTAAELIQMAQAGSNEKGKTRPYEKDGLKGLQVIFPDFELYYLNGKAGAKVLSEPGLHKNTAEVCLVISGRVRICIRDDVQDLGPGESLRFKALHEHEIEVLSDSSFILAHHNLI